MPIQESGQPEMPTCGKNRERFLMSCPNYAHERWPLLAPYRQTAPTIIELLSKKKQFCRSPITWKKPNAFMPRDKRRQQDSPSHHESTTKTENTC
jgi:hypothetical protein